MPKTNLDQSHLGGAVFKPPYGDPWTYCPKIWDYFIHEENVKRMLDVGCGVGYSTQYFQRHGCFVTGIEADPLAIVNYRPKKSSLLIHDFTLGKTDLTYFHYDLVWCCEFVEHVESQYEDNILDTFSHGKTIAMTHALPGQPGTHHVNCQFSLYWIKRICDYGYTYDIETTVKLRSLVGFEQEGHYFYQSGLIFRKQS